MTLFASGDSRTLARLESVYPKAPSEWIGHSFWELRHATACLEQAVEGRFDIVHDHSGCSASRSARWLPFRSSIPCTGRWRARPALYESICRMAPRAHLVSLTHAQRLPRPRLPWLANCPNALNVDLYPFHLGHDDYLLFLGRMNAEKGAHRAIEVAREAGVPLRLAGKCREPLEQAYFDTQVRPHLGDAIEYVGEVSHADKVELLRARATIFPIDWEEPFGLVMIESGVRDAGDRDAAYVRPGVGRRRDRDRGRRLPPGGRCRRRRSTPTTCAGACASTSPRSGWCRTTWRRTRRRSTPTGATRPRPDGQRSKSELLARDVNGDVANRDVADRPAEAPSMRVSVEDEIGAVRPDRGRKPARGGRPRSLRLADERFRHRRVVQQDDTAVTARDGLEPGLERLDLERRLVVDAAKAIRRSPGSPRGSRPRSPSSRRCRGRRPRPRRRRRHDEARRCPRLRARRRPRPRARRGSRDCRAPHTREGHGTAGVREHSRLLRARRAW